MANKTAHKAPPRIDLMRTRGATLRYRLSSKWFRVTSAAVVLALVIGGAVWQYPTLSRVVQQWAVSESGRDELLAAQATLSDRLTDADVVLRSTNGDLVSAKELTETVDHCREVRTTAGSAEEMLSCASAVIQATGYLALQNDRYRTFTSTVALIKQDTDEKARVEAAWAAAEKAAAAEAERVRVEKEAARSRQNTGGTGGGTPKPRGGGGGGGGQSLSSTVTCSGPATVFVSASGGGTVSISISGAGSNSASGSGAASASASGGAGTYYIRASSTSGGLSLSPSWSGACR